MSKQMMKINQHTPYYLVVSYSYSGNTHWIAQALQGLTEGELCEIHPWQPYPTAFTELLEQVRQEVKRQYRPRLLPAGPPPRLYPVIIAGSPIWCGTIAPPLAAWLKKNDLAGKIILPFYSHCGGTVGDIRADIEKLCPKSDVRPPLGIIKDEKGNLDEVLHQWFKENNLVLAKTFRAG